MEVTDLKHKLIDHLMSLDLSKMQMYELCSYTNIVTQINSMDKADYLDRMVDMLGKNTYGIKTDEPKGDENNG